MCTTTNQSLLAGGAPFPTGGFADRELAVDPLLEAMDPPSPMDRKMVPTTTTMITATTPAESQYFVNNEMWNSALGDPMSKQMPYLNTFEGYGAMEMLDSRIPDIANSSTMTTQTRSTSPTPTSRSSRKRSETSSRSSIPSITKPSSSAKSNQKSQSSKQSTRQRRQSSRKPSVPRPQPQSQEFDEEDEKRRHRFLERNRVAASKCRAKKKEWVSELEETREGLESQNSHLHLQYNSLASELSQIKTELMAHANCQDIRINQWIENEARRFVMETARRFEGIPVRHPSVQEMEGARRGSFLMQPSPASSIEAQLLSPQSPKSSLEDQKCYTGPVDMFDSQATA